MNAHPLLFFKTVTNLNLNGLYENQKDNYAILSKVSTTFFSINNPHFR